MASKTVNDLEREYYIAQLGLAANVAASLSLNDLKWKFFTNPPAGGGVGANRVVTSADTITTADDTIVFNGASPISQALPDPTTFTAYKLLRLVNIGSGNLTITSSISNTATTVMPQYESISVFSTGTAWVLVSSTNKQQLALKAPIASPTFTGTVVIPTPAGASEPATKQYVDNKQAENFPNQATNPIRITGAGASVPGSGNDGDLYISTIP